MGKTSLKIRINYEKDLRVFIEEELNFHQHIATMFELMGDTICLNKITVP